GIHRLLDPQRAVLVERRDAFAGRDEARVALRRRRLHELDDRLLRRTVVPGGQGIGLRVRVNASEQPEKRDPVERRLHLRSLPQTGAGGPQGPPAWSSTSVTGSGASAPS